MRHPSAARGSIEGALCGLMIGAFLCGSTGLGAAAQDGWAPVVVLAARDGSAPGPPLPPAPPASGHVLRAEKASPAVPDPARPTIPVPAVREAKAEPKPESVPPEAGKPAQHAQDSAAEPGSEPDMKSLDEESGKASPAQQYCANIADAAADARFAWQKKTLAEVRQEVDKRVAVLESKIAEYRKWLARRDEFSKKANDSLIKIYSRMRPDAAAQQLVKMDEETAAAILLRLDARNASSILNEIPPAQAARLAATIAGAARRPKEGRKS